jgi:hypothetical protein
VCDNLLQAARKSLILKTENGEMSEWLKEHAWKAILTSNTKQHRSILLRCQYKDLAPQKDSSVGLDEPLYWWGF